MKVFAFFVAIAGGAGLSYLLYLASKHVLLSKQEHYQLISSVRTVVMVLYLTGMFFLGRKLECAVYTLIGGASGMIVPMIYFTLKLIKLTDKKREQKNESTQSVDESTSANVTREDKNG